MLPVFPQRNDSSGSINDSYLCADSINANNNNNLDDHSVIEHEIENGDGEGPFFVCDLSVIVNQFRRWRALLPRVESFYAVKCNGDKEILKTLNNLGAGFDCASKGELSTILEMGIDPSRIIFANPCKLASHICYSRAMEVKLMTFDNLNELVKIKRHFPEAELILRIATDDAKSAFRLSMKFGASLPSVGPLLQAAKSMNLNVVGISFHVGSGCYDTAQYFDAIRLSRLVWDKASEIGFDFTILDIGGGFPGDDDGAITFKEIADVVSLSLDTYFDPLAFPNLRIISEPGRYFVTMAFTLVVSITSCRPMSAEGNDSAESASCMYYVNDGVYGSLNCVLSDPICSMVRQRLEIVTQHHRFLENTDLSLSDNQKIFNSSIWGPTCDCLDCIIPEIALPELDIGDWLLFKHMGAYTIAIASTFNGFSCTSKVLYIGNREQMA